MASGPGRDRGGIRIQEPGESNAAAAAAEPSPPAPPSDGSQERPHGPSGAEGGSPSAAAAAVEPPPPAPPSDNSQERPHGPLGAEGGSPSAAAAARKGKGVLPPSPLPSPTRSESEGTSSPASSGESSSANTLAGGNRRLEVSWKNPLVEAAMEVPKVTRPMDMKSAFDLSLEQQWALAEEMETQQWQQAQQRKSLWSKFKVGMANVFLERIGRKVHNCNPDSTAIVPHVNHQTIPTTRIIEHYNLIEMVAGQGVIFHSNALNLRRAYSEFRPVHGDGECFYRSFIFSYLEQVLDRQDTHEEHRLLAAVRGVARHHARLGWTYEFSSRYKAFKTLIKKVMRWKRHNRWKNVPTTDSYRKQKLLKFFSGYGRTDDIFAFLRLVAAIWICSHNEEFEPLIPELNEYGTLREWCFHKVIRNKVFTDQVQMTALVTALGVPLRVEYLFQEAGQDLYIGQDSQDDMPRSTCWPRDHHQLPSDHEVPHVTVLYTQGHYDIIYPYHTDGPVTSDESSGQRSDKIKSLATKSPSRYQIGRCRSETSNQQIDQFSDRIGNFNQNYTRPHVNYKKFHITEIIRHYNHLETVAGQGVKFRSHALNLSVVYSEFRPVIGDGECFYRSFIFSYLEQVLDRQDTHEEHRLLAAVKEVARQHARLGWDSEFSRSQKVFKKLIKKVMRWKTHRRWKHVPTSNSHRVMKLLEFFHNYERTDDIFTFLRLVVAIWICSHSEEFVPLIPEVNGDYSLTNWCLTEVIRRRIFSDHVQITALVMALGVPLRVEFLTEGLSQDLHIVQDHEIPRVTLLYGFKHYDILYPRRDDEGAESSSQQITKEDTCSGVNLNDHGGWNPFLAGMEPTRISLPLSKIESAIPESLEQEWMENLSSGVIPETICGEVHKKSTWKKPWRPADCKSESLTKMGPLVSNERICVTETWNLEKLWKSYIFMRAVRRDGECFYRSFIFSYLEQVIARQDIYEEHRLLADVNRVYRQHALVGLSLEFSRANRAFNKLIKKVMRWKRSRPLRYREQKLYEFFNNYERSSYILDFLRLIAALYICSHSEEFKLLVPELTKGLSLRDWCLTEIIQMKVSIHDDIQMQALARALGVPLRLEYLSGENKDLYTPQHIDDDMPRSTCCQNYRMPSDYEIPCVTLLFTEEEYYILYPGLSALAYKELNVPLLPNPCV